MENRHHICDAEAPDSRSAGLLRPRDQLTVAVSTAAASALVLVWWTWQGGLAGRMIDIDQIPPGQVRFAVDVNTADWPELVQVPGIGRVLAGRIVQWRREHGPFRSTDDLLQIQGIGPRTMERIRPYLLPVESAAGTSSGTAAQTTGDLAAK